MVDLVGQWKKIEFCDEKKSKRRVLRGMEETGKIDSGTCIGLDGVCILK